jgi:putative ABC transport system permease protein
LITQTFNNQTGTGNAMAIPLAAELRTKYASDFKHVALSSWNFGFIMSVGQKKIANQGMWVQSEFPAMIGARMLDG